MKKNGILSAIYADYIEELPPTSKYREITKELEKERKIFLTNIGEQNSERLENICDIVRDADNELCKRAFSEGFSLAVRLFIEALSED